MNKMNNFLFILVSCISIFSIYSSAIVPNGNVMNFRNGVVSFNTTTSIPSGSSPRTFTLWMYVRSDAYQAALSFGSQCLNSTEIGWNGGSGSGPFWSLFCGSASFFSKNFKFFLQIFTNVFMFFQICYLFYFFLFIYLF